MLFDFGFSIPRPDLGPATTRTLKLGDKGADVEGLQRKLIAVGYGEDYSKSMRWKVVVDGDFGSNTNRAVLEFQKAYGLKVDGIVGPDTLAALEKARLARVQEGKPLPTETKPLPTETKPLPTETKPPTVSVEVGPISFTTPPPSEAKKKPAVQTEPIEITGQVPKSDWVMWGLGIGVLALGFIATRKD